jgi:hypothetical protein
MEAPLLGKRIAGPDLAPRQREGFEPFGLDAELLAGVIFLAQLRDVAFLGWEQVAVEASEVGVDALVAADRLDPVHAATWLS